VDSGSFLRGRRPRAVREYPCVNTFFFSFFSSFLAGVHGDEKSKEGDITFIPRERADNDNEEDCPTVVLEVGVWESMAKLRRDAADWLRFKNDAGEYQVSNNGSYVTSFHSSIQVTIVILLKLFLESQKFTGEVWRHNSSGGPERTFSREFLPTDTTGYLVSIPVKDFYGNCQIPTFLQGSGPVTLNLQALARDARRSLDKSNTKKRKAQEEAQEETAPAAGSSRKSKKTRTPGG
jgi:hypothetical protein